MPEKNDWAEIARAGIPACTPWIPGGTQWAKPDKSDKSDKSENFSDLSDFSDFSDLPYRVQKACVLLVFWDQDVKKEYVLLMYWDHDIKKQ